MLIRHSLLFTVAKLAPGLVGIATTALLTRLLDPAAYGAYGLALAVASFGATMGFDWLGLAYLRFSQAPGQQAGLIGTTLVLFGVVLGVAALVAAFAFAGGGFSGLAAPAVAAGLLMMAAGSAFELASRVQVAAMRPVRLLMMNGGRAVLTLAGAAGLAWLTGSPVWAACGMALGTVAAVLPGGMPVGRMRFDGALAVAMLRFGAPLAVSMAMTALATSGVRGLLDALGSAEALGLYTAGFLLVQNSLSVAAAAIASAGYPRAVRALEAGNVAAAQRQVSENIALLLTVLAPMAAGMALTAPGIAALLVGPAYQPSLAALTPWLAATGLFAGLRAHGLDHAFQLGRRPGLQVQVTAVAAGFALGLSGVLIPVWGPVGAAIACAIGAAVSCGHALIAGRLAWRIRVPWGTVVQVGLACAVMAGCVRVAPGGLAGQVAAGTISYAAVLAAGYRRRASAAMP